MLDQPNNYQFPKEVQDLVIDNFSLEDNDYIWLLGRYKFDGYVKFFENKLLSANIQRQSVLLYWLGEDGTSTIGFQKLSKILKNKKIDIADNWRFLDALYFYMYSPDSNIRLQAIDLALEIYNSKNIYNKILKNDEYGAKDFETGLLSELFSTGESKIIPLAKKLYAERKYEDITFAALVANDCSGYKNELLDKLNNEKQDKYIVLKASIAYIKACNDVSIIPLISKKYNGNNVKEIVDFFDSRYLINELEAALDLFEDQSLAERIKNQILISTKTANGIVKDLFEMGIISELDTTETIKKVKDFQNQSKSQYHGQISTISPYFYFLDSSHINTRYYLESSVFPVQYDEILYNALKLSASELGNPKIYSIISAAEDLSIAKYKIFIDFGNFGITTNHVSTSLRPNTKFIVSTLNLCNSKSKSKNKFLYDYISESNVIFYTDPETYLQYSRYLKNGCNY